MSASFHYRSHASLCLEALPRTEKRWLSLLSLRLGAVLCPMTAVICFAWAYTEHEKPVAYIDGLGSAWSSINLGTSAFAFVWSTISLIIVLGFNRRVPPGVGITFDCLAFLAQIITVSFYLNEFAEYQRGGYSEDTQEAKTLYGVECFGMTMMLLGLTINLILMIRSSVECHTERISSKRFSNKPQVEDI